MQVSFAFGKDFCNSKKKTKKKNKKKLESVENSVELFAQAVIGTDVYMGRCLEKQRIKYKMFMPVLKLSCDNVLVVVVVVEEK